VNPFEPRLENSIYSNKPNQTLGTANRIVKNHFNSVSVSGHICIQMQAGLKSKFDMPQATHTHARPHFLREFPEQYFTAQDIPFRHCCTGKWSPPFVPQWWEKLTQVLQLQFDLQMTQRETWQEIEVENFAESRGKMRKMRQVGLGKFNTRRGKWN